jgi:hypothetical protein
MLFSGGRKMAQDLVIARGFGGEPKRLTVRGAAEGRVLVGIADKNASDESVDNVVSLPRSNVFEFEAQLFKQLTEEWEMMGRTDPDTWRALRPWGSRARADA